MPFVAPAIHRSAPFKKGDDDCDDGAATERHDKQHVQHRTRPNPLPPKRKRMAPTLGKAGAILLLELRACSRVGNRPEACFKRGGPLNVPFDSQFSPFALIFKAVGRVEF